MVLEESVLMKRETEGSDLTVIYPEDGCIPVPSPVMIVDDKYSANANAETAAAVTTEAVEFEDAIEAGSGDAFLGALLYRLAGKKLADLKALTDDELRQIVRFGSAAGGLTATARGAIPAMPDEKAIEDCMAHMPVYGA